MLDDQFHLVSVEIVGKLPDIADLANKILKGLLVDILVPLLTLLFNLNLDVAFIIL